MAHCELGRDCRCFYYLRGDCSNWITDAIPTSPEHPALNVPRVNGMAALLADVRAFHEATDTPVLDRPQWPGVDRALLRERLLREEVHEFTMGLTDDGNIIEVADALADIIYICVGTALEFGIPLDRVWAEVQRTNMAKIDPATGKCRRRMGKILKPEGWTPPDIVGALGLTVDNQQN